MNRIDKGFKFLDQFVKKIEILEADVSRLNKIYKKLSKKAYNAEHDEWWRLHHNLCEDLCFRYHLGRMSFKQFEYYDLFIKKSYDGLEGEDKKIHNWLMLYGGLFEEFHSCKGFKKFKIYLRIKFRL